MKEHLPVPRPHVNYKTVTSETSFSLFNRTIGETPACDFNAGVLKENVYTQEVQNQYI